ncbi:MAG: phosphoribosylformimino-5-aminoimidazole carboxamide ribotide isomerase [Eubacteriales bacterium]|nr:phosphoribosylformimino-5-aminoimidazole carboxamide ribotide isomerase [Eubacteriales bacterium]
MLFRPCIDIHNGQIKQIVGGSLLDAGDYAKENFVSDKDGGYYASLYKDAGLYGGHIILLNPADSEYYEADVTQAKSALMAYPGGLMVGGGINRDNAAAFLDAGASHVIVTSYVFKNGEINFTNLNRILNEIGREHLVLDLSCRKKGDDYYIVTDRWQNFTNVKITKEILDELSDCCDEYLIHAVDVEGKASGIESPLVKLLSNAQSCPITYAGGVGSYSDLQLLKELGHNKIDVTIGSALNLFGGSLEFKKVLEICRQ